ncbi:phosphatase PAP2 family protein [Leucobacter sp. HNU]|uniref:phosphatase PAP2 family protein n=1 Tax=Leucobacter sp. HNU TaxID=3236805 RepID=UPI003A805985
MIKARSPRPRGISGGAIGCAWLAIAVVVAFGVFLLIGGGDPTSLDTAWHDAVGAERGSFAAVLATDLAGIGGWIGVTTCGLIACAGLFAARRPRDAGILITALVLGVAASELLKLLIGRQRPADMLIHAAGSSYPSGHSLSAATLAVTLAIVLARTAPPPIAKLLFAAAASWVLLMMWSRTALHVHWLTDTLGGALLGTAVAVLSAAAWQRRERRIDA